MLRALPFIVEIVLLVFCLIDCIQSPREDVRNLPKWAWVVLILFVPLVGGIAWLVAGRPRKVESAPTWRPRAVAPEDDPTFLEQLRRGNDDHEQMLETWEDDLRRRERELKDDDGTKDE